MQKEASEQASRKIDSLMLLKNLLLMSLCTRGMDQTDGVMANSILDGDSGRGKLVGGLVRVF